MWYFVSADIGTQGTKAAIVGENGAVVAASFQPSRLIRGSGGSVEQDPEELFRSVVLGIREALAAAKVPASQVAAIGLDGQMAGILGIDREWNAVTPYDSWLDTRCETAMPLIREWGEEAYIRLTGAPVTYAHGPKKLWWMRERPDVYRRIDKFVVPSAYVAGRLAGLGADRAFIDYTHLHFTGFADAEAMRWSTELTEAFGLDARKLPSIAKPWDVIGRLQPTYAEATGLMSGTPIVAGCGDTAAASLGGGLTKPGRLLDIAGTASVLACCVERYVPDAASKTLIFARSVLPDLWSPLAYINGGGECLAWYRALVGPDDASLTFDELNSRAEAVAPGSDGLLFVPHFGGSVCPNDASLRGAWLGLNWTHGKASLYRSIMEAVAYEYRSYLDILERLSGPVAYREIHAAGGGAKSALFNRIKADVLGIPVRPLRNADTALTANAVIAGYGVGLFPDLAETAESFLAHGGTTEPDEAAHRLYAPYARRYKQAVNGLSALYGALK